MPATKAADQRDGRLSFWPYAIVILGALLMAAGAMIALLHPSLLLSPHAEITEGVRIYAGYLASRNLGMAILLLVALSLGAKEMLNNLMILAAFIQLLDVGIDCVEGRWAVAPGVFVLGIVFFIAAFKVSGYPIWRIEAWKYPASSH